MAIIRQDDNKQALAIVRRWRRLSPAIKSVVTVSAGGVLWAAGRLLRRTIPTINVNVGTPETRAVQPREAKPQARPRRRMIVHARRMVFHRTPDGHVYGDDVSYTMDVDDDR